ncbi:hypothetical protein C1893_09610 [Pseudomonas sp. MPR-ANC1]|nr:hypothetical protein C1893_09610 [Pseudomonas sp. MPR-ANC1]
MVHAEPAAPGSGRRSRLFCIAHVGSRFEVEGIPCGSEPARESARSAMVISPDTPFSRAGSLPQGPIEDLMELFVWAHGSIA